MKFIRILRIVSTLAPSAGGVSEAIKQSISMLYSEYSIVVDVVSFDDGVSYLDDFQCCGAVHYSLRKGMSAYVFSFEYLSWLWSNIKKYDLVVIDGLWQFHVFGGYIAKVKQVPFVVFSHGMLDPYFNGDVKRYIKKIPFWFFVERNVLALSKAVVFTTKNEEEKSQNSFPLSKWRSQVCTLGVVPEKTICYLATGDVIFLSRVHPKKGIELLIEAVSRSEFIYSVKIFGPGDPKYIESLKTLSLSFGVESSFVWMGSVWGETKWKILSKASLFVLTSYQENFGIAIVEALSVGVPVLITENIDISDSVSKYGAGFVVKANPVSIQSALETWAVMSQDEKNEMSVRAFKCYQDCFSLDVSVSQLSVLIHKIIDSDCKDC